MTTYTDRQKAFKSLCADMGAISALLGFDDYPGIDALLRSITDLIVKNRAALESTSPTTAFSEPAGAGDVRGEPVAWRYLTPTGWHATTKIDKALGASAHHTMEPLYAAPSRAALDAKTALEVKASLWDEVRSLCVPHGAGVDKPITEWLEERLASPSQPAAPAVDVSVAQGEPIGYVNAGWMEHRKGTTKVYTEPHARLATAPIFAASLPRANDAQATDYEALEREHMGDPDKRTGIYAPATAAHAGAAGIADAAGAEIRTLRGRALPADITPPVQDVLRLMLWQTTPIAHALRATGRAIPRKCEDEQAIALHWLLGFALERGDDWQKHAAVALRQLTDQIKDQRG